MLIHAIPPNSFESNRLALVATHSQANWRGDNIAEQNAKGARLNIRGCGPKSSGDSMTVRTAPGDPETAAMEGRSLVADVQG